MRRMKNLGIISIQFRMSNFKLIITISPAHGYRNSKNNNMIYITEETNSRTGMRDRQAQIRWYKYFIARTEIFKSKNEQRLGWGEKKINNEKVGLFSFF